MVFNLQLLFLGLGGVELFVIALVLLILFGGKRLPELMRGLGKGIREFKDATNAMQDEIMKGVNEKPLEDKKEDSEEKDF